MKQSFEWHKNYIFRPHKDDRCFDRAALSVALQEMGVQAKIINPNLRWHSKNIQQSDLPIKAQKFIDLLGIAVETVNIRLINADPNGDLCLALLGTGTSPLGMYDSFERTIYLLNDIKVGVTIHELMHVYIFDKRIDSQPIVETYKMEHEWHWKWNMSNYGRLGYLYGKYDEALCEIVAKYGRRGQFERISELLAL